MMRCAPANRIPLLLVLILNPSITLAQCSYDFEGGFPFAGASSAVRASALFDDGSGLKLYLADPQLLGPTRVKGFLSFDGSTWAPVGGGVDGFIQAMTVHAGAIYICGDFHSVGGIAANRVARWDGAAWSALADGLPNSNSWAMATYGSDLYVGRTSSPYLMRWNGTAWSSIENLEMSAVDALGAYRGRLYVSGDLRIPGAATYENIAAWDGVSWLSVGGGFDQPGHAHALVVIDDDLYAGGHTR